MPKPRVTVAPAPVAAQTEQSAQDVVPPASYEAALGELETLVVRLESGELPLDQLLAGYQRGAGLLQFCRDKLQAVEEQIKVLDGDALKAWKPQ